MLFRSSFSLVLISTINFRYVHLFFICTCANRLLLLLLTLFFLYVQPQGWTPLMLAAQNGNLEITRLLCSQPDIQLDAVDNVRSVQNYVEIMNFSPTTQFGNTAIDIAKSHNHNLVHEELENRTHMKVILNKT